jgi:hypothetical protein
VIEVLRKALIDGGVDPAKVDRMDKNPRTGELPQAAPMYHPEWVVNRLTAAAEALGLGTYKRLIWALGSHGPDGAAIIRDTLAEVYLETDPPLFEVQKALEDVITWACKDGTINWRLDTPIGKSKLGIVCLRDDARKIRVAAASAECGISDFVVGIVMDHLNATAAARQPARKGASS